MITINGKSYKGKNVRISNNKVYIDGKLQDDKDIQESKQIFIEVHGDLSILDVDVCENISVSGETGLVKTVNGDIICKDIAGDVTTVNGDVRANIINGNCKTVNGDISK